MDLVEAFAREIVREGAYGFDRALEEGVSPGFLGVVLDDNLEEVVALLLARAKEAGEFGCSECDEYRDLKEAWLDGGVAKCPKCGAALVSACCAVCGRSLYGPEGCWRGVHVRGFCVCTACEAEARRLLAAAG